MGEEVGFAVHSIRWRLTLSYAGIALFAAAILGAVLLGVLDARYSAAEREYMAVNAGLIADQLEQSRELPVEARDAQLQVFSFLTQTRVRLLDEEGEAIADSGPPAASQPGPTSTLTSEASRSGVTTYPLSAEAGVLMTSGVLPAGTPDEASGIQPDAFLQAVVGPISGFVGPGLGSEGGGAKRSSEVARALYDAAPGSRWTVELSLGPDYGSEIMRTTTITWLIASAVAVLLAGLAGIFVSRRLSAPVIALTETTRRMADGDLATRASPGGWDEIGILARSFNEMAEQIEGTVETLRRFIGDAAHQLNTPITALHANLELLGRPDAPPETAGRALDQVKRLERLTRDMLDLSRVEAGGRPHEDVDLVAVVREAVDAFASRAEQSGIELLIMLPEGDAIVSGDRSQLFDALSNLVDNALKFTPAGGTVSLLLEADGGSFVLSAIDTGMGIPDADMTQLFSRFHRGRNAADFVGSGLGLAIVKAIIDAHQGAVEVTSSSVGTRMSIRLRRSGD